MFEGSATLKSSVVRSLWHTGIKSAAACGLLFSYLLCSCAVDTMFIYELSSAIDKLGNRLSPLKSVSVPVLLC